MIRIGLSTYVRTIFVCTLLTFGSLAHARTTERVTVQSVTRSATGLSLSLTLPEPTWRTVATDNGDALIAEFLEEGVYTPGEPALPALKRLVRLPSTGAFQVELVNAEFELLQDVDVALYLDSDHEAYRKNGDPVDAWFPSDPVSLGSPAIMKDFRVAPLSLSPVQVNPATREARMYTSLVVNLIQSNGSGSNELSGDPTAISAAYLPFYRDLLDWDENELDQYALYRGAVEVVTRSEAVPLLENWNKWKQQKGWVLDFLTEEDVPSWTFQGIQTELRERYANSETPFDYVVIIGDAQGSFSVPPSGNILEGYGDHGYSCVNGTDDLSDVAIGRISVETDAQIVAYTNKVLGYEKTPYLGNPDWFRRGMVAAGAEESGPTTYYFGRWARHLMLANGFNQVDTAWYDDGLGDVNDRIRIALNNGVSFFFYRGLIGTGLDPDEISQLINSFTTPFVLDVTCSTGNWYGGLGYNEAWMRAGTVTTPRGAIGAIGTATAYTRTGPNNALSSGAVKSVFIDHNQEMGLVWYGAMINLYRNFKGVDDETVDQFSLWANLMGDPTVWLWTDTPTDLTVAHDYDGEVSQNVIEVTVEDEGTPVEGAWVTVYKVDDDEEVIGRGITDGAGRALIEAPIRNVGQATLTVTAPNYRPSTTTLDVNSEAGLGVVSWTLLDDGSNGTEGNGNGLAEPGEVVGIWLSVKNFGPTIKHAVYASLASDDPTLAIFQDIISFGDIATGETIEASTLTLFAIQPEARQDWIAEVNLDLQSDEGTWSDDFLLPLAAPRFELVDVVGNEEIGPGENGSFSLHLKNTGQASISSASAELTTSNTFIQILDRDAGFFDVGPGDTVEVGEFTVTHSLDSFNGLPMKVRLFIETDVECRDTLDFTIPLGHRGPADPLGPDSYGYYAFENSDEGFEKTPTFNWVEICPTADSPDFMGSRLDQINDTNIDVSAFYARDDAQVVDLPFTVQYYGEEFDQLTVTANGMVAMGAQADIPLNRNWTIPSPLGPNYMIAPFWDDRLVVAEGDNNSDRGVYHYFDEENDRYIIEWYQVLDVVDPEFGEFTPCTFELIFYDYSLNHATESHDNEFLFQYLDVAPSQGNPDNDNPSFTTGIENGNQTGGLLCSYWDQLETGMTSIEDGRAILFTTQYFMLMIDVPEREEVIPLDWSLEPAWPNPFNGTTNLRFSLPEAAEVRLAVYNLLGQEVAVLQNGQMAAGRYEIPFTTDNLGNGLYFVTLEAGRFRQTRKVVLLK